MLNSNLKDGGKITIIEELFKHKDVEFIKLDLPQNKLARKTFNASQIAEQLMLNLS